MPVDFELSTEDDFRGITSLELSGLLDRLTAKTQNVTVVRDYCFAGRLFCDLDLVAMKLPDVRAHVMRLWARGIRLR